MRCSARRICCWRSRRAWIEDPQRVLATLERSVGRGGFHYGVSHGHDDGLGDGYRYTARLTNLDALGDACVGPGRAQLRGVSSNHSWYEAIVTVKWSKKPVRPRSPNDGAHGSQNQTGADHAYC